MKRNYVINIGVFIICAILCLALFGCVQQVKNENSTKVGVILPLTGFLANVGKDTQNAIELAVNDANALTKIELIYEDDACDSTKAVTAYQKLASVDKVNFIIGPFCGQSAIAILPLLNNDRVISISPGAPDNELSKPNDYFFRTRIPNKSETKIIVDYLVSKGIFKVAVYTARNTFGQSYHDSFVNQFVDVGGEIVFDDGSADYQVDFKTDLLKIKEKNPQAIFLVPASRQQMGIFAKQARELGVDILFTGGAVTEQQDLLDAAGIAANGIIYPYVSPKNMEIFYKYVAGYGKIPSMEALNGYDAFNILFGQIQVCDGNKECVRNNLNKLKDFNGAEGLISFDENGDSRTILGLKQVKDEKFVLLSDTND